VLEFEGIPTDKRAAQHPLMWFDRNVFRTVAGGGRAYMNTRLCVYVCVCVSMCVCAAQQPLTAIYTRLQVKDVCS